MTLASSYATVHDEVRKLFGLDGGKDGINSSYFERSIESSDDEEVFVDDAGAFDADIRPRRTGGGILASLSTSAIPAFLMAWMRQAGALKTASPAGMD